MTGATYADLCRSVPASICTVRRVGEAFGIKGTPLSAFDSTRILAVECLHEMGFVRPVAVDVLEGFSSELRYVARSPEHEAWAFFIESLDGRAFRVAATSRGHLAAMASAFPLALVLPLHRVWEDASTRLRKAQRAAGAQGEAA